VDVFFTFSANMRGVRQGLDYWGLKTRFIEGIRKGPGFLLGQTFTAISETGRYQRAARCGR